MSIRLRMTLLYSSILALTLIVFSLVLYAIQARYSLRILENDLAQSARISAQALTRFAQESGRFPSAVPRPGRPGNDQESSPADPQWQELAGQGTDEWRPRDTWRLLSLGGLAIDLPVDQQDTPLPLSEQGLERLQQGQAWVEIATVEERLLIYNQPIEVDGQIVGIVQTARPLTDRDRTMQALGMTLIAGSSLTVLVAFGMGWFLSGMALQPIHRITQTAQEIGQERDFAQRVVHQGPNDELGRLAMTFNGMLSGLQAAYQRVAHSLQVQRGFVADVSHELRTPLTTLRGNLALLRHGSTIPQEEREDILTDMVDETERLIRLVSDLLTLARADAGRSLESEAVEVKALIEDVCRQARVLEPGREIECSDLDDLLVRGDRDALKQVLLILIDNALKYTSGPVEVALKEGERLAMIDVRDKGPGMSPELCERIFDRFYQGDPSRSIEGFGLGLSIARALTEAQQGTIGVQSEVGVGSTFTVQVPMYVA